MQIQIQKHISIQTQIHTQNEERNSSGEDNLINWMRKKHYLNSDNIVQQSNTGMRRKSFVFFKGVKKGRYRDITYCITYFALFLAHIIS